MEMTIVAGICKTNIYRNGCYLRLFKKRDNDKVHKFHMNNDKVYKFHKNNSSFLKTSASFV